ncbi:Alpha/Beta hydrolase protein [Chaetomium sp. MPI-SDFR-AT-0129]|nr:Alpha/Beta hydrolase protein [Chaetomium sp. MPI-SDFR-AT-0129]
MRFLNNLTLISLFPLLAAVASEPIPTPDDLPPDPSSPLGYTQHLKRQQQQEQQQHPLSQPSGDDHRQTGVSHSLFASLERASRLVDIAYCVGTFSGLSPPFSCPSRCGEFPSLRLICTWNTGVLLSDSCGYIAVDHGQHPGSDDGGLKEEDEAGRKEIVVAFRGTYSVTNTVIDLSTVPQEYVPYPAPPDGGDGDGDENHDGKCDNCTVHMGFMASWRNAREIVVPALKEAREKYPGYKVHLIGHSLGGAVAALAALELRLGLGWHDVLVTTFGEPRVGNQKLADYIDRAFKLLDQIGEDGLSFRRVTHVGDPVPLLPLTEWGYRSHAGEVYITKSDLQPAFDDLRLCHGDNDPECMAAADMEDWLSWMIGLRNRPKQEQGMNKEERAAAALAWGSFPSRLKLWQLFFAHRDYFWRLGLCVPGGDPMDWGRDKYNLTATDELEDQGRDL